MKNKKYLIVVGLILLLIIGSKLGSIKKTKTTSKHSDYSLKLISAPKEIDNIYKPVTIQVELSNNSNTPITYQDLVNKKYQISVCRENSCYPIWMKIGIVKASDGVNERYNSTIEDFGEIAPQKSKVITIKTGSDQQFEETDVMGTRKLYLVNLFGNIFIADHQNKTNGKAYQFYVELNQVKDETHKPRLAKTKTFEVINNAYDNQGEFKLR